jgi:hypothetical protein
MSELAVVPVVGNRYRLGDEVVEVVEALKRRYWRIVVATLPDCAMPFRTIPQSEWAAKAQRVES